MNVGSMVRIRRRPGGMTQRAMISTIEEDSACVLLEEDHPQPIDPSNPLSDSSVDPSSGSDAANVMQQWKQRGDALLQLQDFVAAIPYYEYALRLSSQSICIGTTVLIQEGGHIRAAEVDCIEDSEDDPTTILYDVTMVESGEEKTLTTKDILLGLLEPHADHLQERILLNLSRCLLHWVEAAADAMDSQKRRAMVQGAVRATSLSWTIATILHRNEAEEDADTLSKLQISALLLRSQAQMLLQKHAHALADIQKVLKAFPDHKEATALLQKLQRQKKQVQKTNQRLAKHMSQWVQSALQMEPPGPPGHEDDAAVRAPEPNRPPTTPSSPSLISSWPFVCAVVVCVLAWLVPKLIK
jgi:tetratricopeptide (TPR) repeat protein